MEADRGVRTEGGGWREAERGRQQGGGAGLGRPRGRPRGDQLRFFRSWSMHDSDD